MFMTVELVNRSARRLPLRRLEKTTRRIARALERLGRGKPDRRALVVAFISDAESERLNRRFLKKPGPATVLSFDYPAAAEIVLTPAFIRKQARRSDVSLATMIERLIAHGAVHLAGYHHESSRAQARRFERLERELLTYLKI